MEKKEVSAKEVFTEAEKKILAKHVTNVDDDIYCIKNLPEEVVAVIFAYVSRSPNSFKRNLLNLLGSGDLAVDMNLVHDMYGDSKTMAEAKQKAMKFHEKWVVGYGHGSVAEHASIKFAIDKVSILATKILEDNRLGSYTEKSTRYQVFDRDVFYWDSKLMDSEFKEEVIKVVHKLFDTYDKFQTPITEYIKKKNPKPEGVNEKAYENSIKAKVCDIIRYLLPAGTLTAMGLTFNARTAEHAIRKLLSHPLAEARELGQKMFEEGSKICPTLLQFAKYNDYIAETTKEMRTVSSRIVPDLSIGGVLHPTFGYPDESSKPIAGPSVKTLFFDKDAYNHIVAAMLYEFNSQSYELIFSFVEQLSMKQKEDIIDEYLKRRGPFDRPMRALEDVYFTTEIVCDYGAFRDIQRHRMNTQTNPLFTTHLGYDVPEEIAEIGGDLKKEYIDAMENAKQLYETLEKTYPYEAQYIIPLAFKKRVLFKWNLRELEHFIRLRSSVQGHVSYIKIARLCWEEINRTYPLFAKYIKLSMDEEYLGRLRAEIQTQKQIEETKKKYG